MGLFARKSKAEEDQSIDASEATEAEQQPAIVEGKRNRGFLRKRSKNEAQEDLPSGAASESNLQPAQSTAKKGWLGRTSKDEASIPPPQFTYASDEKKKNWLGRTTQEKGLPAPPLQPGDIVPKVKKAPKKKKKAAPKRTWIGRKKKGEPEPEEEEEDDTVIDAADVVQEAPKPPPRLRTPEEIAAGLERQKLAVNAIRNTPEKRAATRLAAPAEIPSTTNATGYSTAPVDNSGGNRAPNDRSGGRFKGMFRAKGRGAGVNMPSMPSVPGFKSKRSKAAAGDSAVVSSSPVKIDPTATPTHAVDADNIDMVGNTDANGVTTPALAAEAKGGRFKGMFMRRSGKAKKASPVKGISGKGTSKKGSSGKGTPMLDGEVELSDQMDQVQLSNEPVLGGQPNAPYSQQAQHAPVQQPAATSGITTQEYAPVLPNGMHSNQLETNGFAQQPASDQSDHYPEGASSYRGGGGNDHVNGYGDQAGGYGGEAKEHGDDDLDASDWEHVNRTWNRN